jgi:hypothetical protein
MGRKGGKKGKNGKWRGKKKKKETASLTQSESRMPSLIPGGDSWVRYETIAL